MFMRHIEWAALALERQRYGTMPRMVQADIDMPQSLLDGDAARLDRAARVGSGRVASAARARKRDEVGEREPDKMADRALHTPRASNTGLVTTLITPSAAGEFSTVRGPLQPPLADPVSAEAENPR